MQADTNFLKTRKQSFDDSCLLLECLVQDDSEPEGMFSDYQNFGTYGTSYPGINKRRHRVAYTFGLGK